MQRQSALAAFFSETMKKFASGCAKRFSGCQGFTINIEGSESAIKTPTTSQ